MLKCATARTSILYSPFQLRSGSTRGPSAKEHLKQAKRPPAKYRGEKLVVCFLLRMISAKSLSLRSIPFYDVLYFSKFSHFSLCKFKSVHYRTIKFTCRLPFSHFRLDELRHCGFNSLTCLILSFILLKNFERSKLG